MDAISPAVGARMAPPMAPWRRVPWPTRRAKLLLMPPASTRAKYSSTDAPVEGVAEAGELLLLLEHGIAGQGRRRAAAVPTDLQGDALADLALHAAVHHRRFVGVGVDVHETRGDATASGVHGARGSGAAQRADGRYPVSLYGHIGSKGRLAGPVDDLAAGDQDVVHSVFSPKGADGESGAAGGTWRRATKIILGLVGANGCIRKLPSTSWTVNPVPRSRCSIS